MLPMAESRKARFIRALLNTLMLVFLALLISA
jgi:hypothetical protein